MRSSVGRCLYAELTESVAGANQRGLRVSFWEVLLVGLDNIANHASTDAELVRQTRAGQRSSFDALIERYQRRAVSVAYRLLGDLQDALEASQDAFLRAYQGLDSLEDPGRFGGWFLRIVTNTSLNHRRARGNRPRPTSLSEIVDEEMGVGSAAGIPSAAERPDARGRAVELSDRIQRAIADLPEHQRVALVLFSIEQMPQKEVAQIMGCSVEAVKWHVFQARKTLREQLDDFITR